MVLPPIFLNGTTIRHTCGGVMHCRSALEFTRIGCYFNQPDCELRQTGTPETAEIRIDLVVGGYDRLDVLH